MNGGKSCNQAGKKQTPKEISLSAHFHQHYPEKRVFLSLLFESQSSFQCFLWSPLIEAFLDLGQSAQKITNGKTISPDPEETCLLSQSAVTPLGMGNRRKSQKSQCLLVVYLESDIMLSDYYVIFVSLFQNGQVPLPEITHIESVSVKLQKPQCLTLYYGDSKKKRQGYVTATVYLPDRAHGGGWWLKRTSHSLTE